jgi:hypothetical protein
VALNSCRLLEVIEAFLKARRAVLSVKNLEAQLIAKLMEGSNLMERMLVTIIVEY